jgi:hypothetical protein
MKANNTDSKSRYYIGPHEEWTGDKDSEERRWFSSLINLDQTGRKKQRFREVRKENSE